MKQIGQDMLKCLKKRVEYHAGLCFRPDDSELLCKALTVRMKRLSIGSPEEYLRLLEAGAEASRQEWKALIPLLTTGESYFFRDKGHFSLLQNSILPELIKSKRAAGIPTITGDASQIRQVIMNLIINAAEAIGDAEGEVDVKLTKTDIKAEQPEKDHLGFTIPAGSYIRLDVTDNGCGMDDDTRRKIFEPFYTTKFTGRGLGMSAVLGIIKSHNGALQFESRLGHGTTFRVYLPVQHSKSETEEAQQITASAPWQGSGTILLAEDEVQVRTIAIILLKEMGFNVLDAANGKEALELYQQNAADITLVVTDMGMPVMNGYELFYKLKQLNPKLPIIISSGFGEGDIGSKIPHEEIAGMVNKPYRFEQLQEVLQRVVG